MVVPLRQGLRNDSKGDAIGQQLQAEAEAVMKAHSEGREAEGMNMKARGVAEAVMKARGVTLKRKASGALLDYDSDSTECHCEVRQSPSPSDDKSQV